MSFFCFIYLLILYSEVISSSDFLTKKRNQKGILGGNSAKEGEFTYQVSLISKGFNMCGGGIIDDQFILTAAHCVIDTENGSFVQEKLTAVMGAVDLTKIGSDAIIIEVEEIYVPTYFNPQWDRAHTSDRTRGDIAVLKLVKPIELDKHPQLKKLQLPQDPIIDYVGKMAIVAGFGISYFDEQGRGHYTGKMRFAKTKVITKQDCRDELPRKIHDTDICAKVKQRRENEPEGVCDGDSGSPLVRDGEIVIGILSANPDNCEEHIGAGVYTGVSAYRTFIDNVIKGIETNNMRIGTWILTYGDCDNPKPYLHEH